MQREATEHERIEPRLLDDAFRVLLNMTVSMLFVPEFPQAGARADDWPWAVPDNWDASDVATADQARLWAALGERYVVTASDTDAGELLHSEDGILQAIFFVSTEQYAKLTAELEAIGAYPSRLGQPLNELAGTSIARLLTERIVPSGAFAEEDRYWLTDPACA